MNIYLYMWKKCSFLCFFTRKISHITSIYWTFCRYSLILWSILLWFLKAYMYIIMLKLKSLLVWIYICLVLPCTPHSIAILACSRFHWIWNILQHIHPSIHSFVYIRYYSRFIYVYLSLTMSIWQLQWWMVWLAQNLWYDISHQCN
jgi:hypothetical protein